MSGPAASPDQVYEDILADVTDELEKSVFSLLLRHAGQPLSRSELIFSLFGVVVENTELANSSFDRKIRLCINRLREKNYPIVSSSGGKGYSLKLEPEEINKTINELGAKIESMQDSIKHLYASKQKALGIREWRDTHIKATQERLF